MEITLNEEQIKQLKETGEITIKADCSENEWDWKPKIDEEYYMIYSNGSVEHVSNYDDIVVRDRYEIGNCFKTKEEAEKKLAFMKAEATLKREVAKRNKGWKPDWSNLKEGKHSVYFDYGCNDLDVVKTNITQRHSNFMYYKTQEIAQDIIDNFSEELKIWLEGY